MNQRRNDQLHRARVHIGGTGRVGTGIVLGLHAAGVGEISFNDPQNFEEEQLDACVFSRRSDIGRPKVHVLARFLEGRLRSVFVPIVATNQSPELAPYLERADLIVSCANQLEARLHLEREAVRLRKPCIQASVQDGREALGGLVSVWCPGADCSCFGCLSPARPKFRRGEVLIPSVTSVIAAIAAHVAVQMLGADAQRFAREHNVLAVDLDDFAIRAMSVKARPSCRICGAGRHTKVQENATPNVPVW
jgi:molybdopterin/thiamine biosynthesis adenylyltransferase